MLENIKTKRFVLLFILLSGLINDSAVFAQDKPKFDPKELINTWVLNLTDIDELHTFRDTLEYIPFNSPLVKNLFFKYSGIQFENNGVFVKHVFIKCATGDPQPDSYQGSWTIISDNNKIKLTTRINDRLNEYYIYLLTVDKLILIKQ